MFSDIRLLDGDGKKPVVIFLHGIHDDGSWVYDVSQQWQEATLIEVVSVGNIAAHDFARRSIHEALAASAKKQIRALQRKHKGHPISIVCHSYGTALLLACVREVGRFRTIVLIASVCKLDAAAVFRSRAEQVVNYCGTRDIWPFIASVVNRMHYGCTGIFGFNQTAYVLDLVFDHGHSGAITADHLNRYVFPGIVYGQFESRARPPKAIPHAWERFADNVVIGSFLALSWWLIYHPYLRAKAMLRSFWSRFW